MSLISALLRPIEVMLEKMNRSLVPATVSSHE